MATNLGARLKRFRARCEEAVAISSREAKYISRIWGLAILLGLALSGGAIAADDTRCIRDGGLALCSEPTVGPISSGAPVDQNMWTYALCDLDGPFTYRARAWCLAMGGTFTGDGCVGAKPVFEGGVLGTAGEFERILTNACQMSAGDSGWGATIPSNILCWSGGPITQNRTLVRDFRSIGFTGLMEGTSGCNLPWSDTVIAGKWRKVECAEGYNTRTLANGDLECWKLPPACPNSKVGNPITLLDGCKAQREIDYRSRTPGGLEVVRYYNSGGYFRFDVAAKKASDVWRSNWDLRILAPPSPAGVLAYAQRADGSVQAFLPNGKEFYNDQGGGAATLQRLTDALGSTSGWQLTTADNDVERYDAAGRLLSLVPRTGRGYALAYDGNGRLSTVTDFFGRTLVFTYDEQGRPSGFIAPENRSWSWGYDGMGRLTTVTNPDGTARKYHYENASFVHALTGITDENGQRFASWSYDTGGHATSSQHAGGAEAINLYYGSFSTSGSTIAVDAFGTTRTYYYLSVAGVLRINGVSESCSGCSGGFASYTYDAHGNVATYRDFNGNQTTYAYDLARNLEISRTEAAGTSLARTVTAQWHPTFRLPTRITAPSGVAGVSEVIDFVYDAHGNVQQKTISAGGKTRQWTSTYSDLGQLLTMDGPRNDVADVTTYTYYDATDACMGCRGNVRTISNAAGHVTTFDGYDADGAPTRSTDASGVITTYSYDGRGRLRSRTVNADQPGAETTLYEYDGVGRLTRMTMPDGSYVRYQYDSAHRLTEISDAGGNVIQYTLDAMDNRIKEDVFDSADRLVKTQQRIYDGTNRLHNDIGANGQTWTYAYDANGNRTAVVDSLNRTERQSFDALNRLAGVTDAAGAITQFAYDAKDRLVSVRDPVNAQTTYGYDGLGNLTQLISADAGTATFVSDAAGNVVSAIDARGASTAYSYDALNRATAIAFTGGGISLEYDNVASGGQYAKGRLTRIGDPSGSTTFAYDPWGRVVTKNTIVGTDASAKAFSLQYRYASGHLVAITYPSGRTASYSFDAQGRVNATQFAGLPVLGGVSYFPFGSVQAWTWANGQSYRREFDNDGRIVTLTLGPDTVRSGDERWTFGYDQVNRLVSAALPSGQTLGYAYDGNGNRKQEARGAAVTSYAYAAASNRLQSLSGATVRSFTYDAAGNMTGNGGVGFVYDARGRMTQTSNGYRYAINGLGQRVAKSGPGVPGGTTYFVYDEGGRLIGEYDATGAARQEFLYLGDVPVASVRPAASGGVDIFPIYSDHLGTPRVITDQANRVVWEWKTDTFGAEAPNENPSGLGAFNFNLRFPGQYYDAETGMHYNYHRDYDPTIGRYEQSDPIGSRGGINTYAYVDSDPISGADPKGLARRDPPPRGPGCGPGYGTGIPDNPLIVFKFRQCCVDHDNCYDDCKNQPTKEACDNTFCACLVEVCNKNPATADFCMGLAGMYCFAAAKGGTIGRQCGCATPKASPGR